MGITNFSESYINKIIRSLKDKKYIEHIGANKNGYWKVLKQYKKHINMESDTYNI